MVEYEIKSRDLEEFDPRAPVAQFRSLLIRGSILFGISIAALGLIAVPAIKNEGLLTAMGGPGIDMMTTGSIGSVDGGGTYRVQRSMTQSGPGDCYIFGDGHRQGAC
ncbi:hypothetical protein DYI37_02385 [Fulvimarina endophytica]|uniref:Uncharacterized protein n=2 Tax=Fulvimarina endophytica TaxID=2293836 RepID=A0A371XAT1_9HYPH|nr:hypothetical protein DYI37_02385 [Fulvimarina endophytica]